MLESVMNIQRAWNIYHNTILSLTKYDKYIDEYI